VYINTLTPSSPALDEKTLVHAYEERSVDGKKSFSEAASYSDRLHKAVFLNYCKCLELMEKQHEKFQLSISYMTRI
jgi:hypothetical protein